MLFFLFAEPPEWSKSDDERVETGEERDLQELEKRFGEEEVTHRQAFLGEWEME